MPILNPVVWGWDRIKMAAGTIGSGTPGTPAVVRPGVPEVRRIGMDDLRAALAQGFADFGSSRTDLIFLCVIYPLLGFLLGRLAFGYNVTELLFPLASGFALVGPLAAVGLNEMSRRREQGQPVKWSDSFAVLRSPAIGSIALLGVILIGIFLLWMLTAEAIYALTLGPEPPASVGSFLRDVFGTFAGWVMIVLGVGIGFLFAVVVLAITVVSFPMMLDRRVGVETAVWTSIRVCVTNPDTMARWGLIIAAGLVLGSIPILLGLAIVMPVLGHATWHLYRLAVPEEG